MADEYLTAALYGMKRFNEGARKKIKELMGMEKLIELLNEYLNDKVGYIQYHNEYGFKRTKTKYEVEGERFLQDEYVLGKKFGFVEWLVENDKVKLEKFPQIMEYSDYESLLMYLSIQDEPIRFLCEILK